MELTPRERISKSRINLLRKNPFFGCLVMRLNPIEDKNLPLELPVGVNNYGDLFYNPKAIETFDNQKLEFVLAHEIMHLCLEHVSRMKARHPKIWSFATDYAVNWILVKNGFPLVQGAIYENKFANLTAEEIYELLRQQTKEENEKESEKEGEKENKGKDSGKGEKNKEKENKINQKFSDDKRIDNHNKWKEKKSKEQQPPNWKQILIDTALSVQKVQGKLPEGLERLLNGFLRPQLSWKEILRNVVVELIKSDFTWQRPAKHYYSTDVYLPSQRNSEGIQLTVAIDTSGSIGEKEFKNFMSEIKAILEEYEYVKLTLIDCDAQVYNVEEISTVDDLIRFKPRGYGGTDFRPIFKVIEEKQIKPKLLIVFTDMFGTYPEEAPYYPTIWVSTTKNPPEYYKPTFGEIIYMDVK